jgi:hypothetical protein
MATIISVNIDGPDPRAEDSYAIYNMEQYTELPYLSVSSPITNIPHLTNLDADLNMPMDQNFNYYTVNLRL